MFEPTECSWCGNEIEEDEQDDAFYVIEGPPSRNSVPIEAFHGGEQPCYGEAADYGWN